MTFIFGTGPVMTVSVTEHFDVQPIDTLQQQRVIEATCRYIWQAGQLYNAVFDEIPVLFDLSGRAAGMYVKSGRGRKAKRKIRYNPWLFGKYFEDNLRNTVPHEVAHYVVDRLYSNSLRHRGLKILPHGEEWRSVMAGFDADASVTCRYDLSGIPRRQHRTVDYRCRCRDHQLGVRRHNKVMRGQASYLCRHCGDRLVMA